ncbi:phosphatidate cytidylyltransferase [Malassezia cuniculi]|uniref:Phosphatidate cytidylyltransferase n=1 Tax=Malassezia cuniculi TaxID=948313 RepID=A0AAF0J4P0_9BASI|nr:phosphatidate cytidylyltransferase [Malassezia cuniculi]
MPREVTNIAKANANTFASRTAFDALTVDYLPSDSEDETPKKVVEKPASQSRKAKKSKSKQSVATDAKTAAEAPKSGAAPAPSTSTEPAAQPAPKSAPKPAPKSEPKPAEPEPAPKAAEPAPKAAATDSADDEAAKAEAVKIEIARAEAANAEAARVAAQAASKTASAPQTAKTEAKPQAKEVSAPQNTKLTKGSEPDPFWKKVRDRTVFTFLMIGGFITVLLMGPAYMILLVLLLETLVYREITGLFSVPGRVRLSSILRSNDVLEDVSPEERERAIKFEESWSKLLCWYFFAVCNFFLYGESLLFYFKHVNIVDAYFLPFARHHQFISFMLYIFGFVSFVINLRRANLKHQFSLFCWIHMSLLIIAMSSHFLVNNILEGMIWFWLPASLVICNDVFAYVCGMLFGRTPLISLSPKKTIEGFVGAFIITEIFAWFWADLFQRYNYMICPVVDLSMNAFSGTTCDINPVFAAHRVALPPALAELATIVAGHPVTTMRWTMFQVHALVMAAFASLVAPFGGFFASGFKRAFNIKDFGDSIPGHGGLTDRFDCQFIMGLFSYVYYSSLIREPRVSVELVLHLVVTQLSTEKQVQLLRQLTQYLAKKGLSA